MTNPTPAAVEEVARIICYWGQSATCRDNYCVGSCQSIELGEWCFKAARRILALPSVGWRTIDSAPKDGTRILIWFVHANAAYSKDPVAEGWEAAHEAYWTDHNGGGWTWYGLCGVAKYWQPLPSPPQPVEDRP